MAVIYGTNEQDFISNFAGTDLRIFGWDRDNGPGNLGPDDDNDRLRTGSGDDLLSGGAGDDRLSGGRGQNTLLGGTGDDVITSGDLASDDINGGAGNDLLIFRAVGTVTGVTVSVADPLTTFVSNGLRVIGVERLWATGGTLDDRFTGGQFADELSGGGGNDTLTGGAGKDRFFVVQDGAADQIFGGKGVDTLEFKRDAFSGRVTVALSGNFILPDGTEVIGVERMSYTGSRFADRVTGGQLNDTIQGGGGDDVLLGGRGDDLLIGFGSVRMDGGAGDDFVTARGLTARAMVQGGSGVDGVELVLSTLSKVGIALSQADLAVSRTFAGGVVVGGFEYVSLSGTDFNDSLTGGALNDTLIGLEGDDSLTGGAGNDVLDGGYLNDTLIGAAGDDRLVDSAGYNLLAGGDGNDTILISDAAQQTQYLYGGDGEDTIDAGAADDGVNGGTGADLLTGRAGDDRFIFNSAPVAGEVDRITDFASVDDSIVLFRSAFAGLGLGVLAAGAFVLGKVAGDPGDRILYDKATGAVWYDADGKGGVAAVQFADLVDGTNLVAADFLIV